MRDARCERRQAAGDKARGEHARGQQAELEAEMTGRAGVGIFIAWARGLQVACRGAAKHAAAAAAAAAAATFFSRDAVVY
jgi:hypothetical protein